MGLWAAQGDPAYGSVRFAQVFGLFGLSSWFWILAFLGFGFKYLTRSRPVLAYANEAVLPFYILHQTVLLCVGYYVTTWAIPDPAKLLIISLSSLAIIGVVYEFLVRRINVLRLLFGMKALPASQQPALRPRARALTGGMRGG